MLSVLNEIRKLRNDETLNVDYTNSNRYRVAIKENDGIKTAYCFSTAVYNAKTRKCLDMKFHKKDGVIYSFGSSSDIYFSNQIRMENTEGYCVISLSNPVSYVSAQELSCGDNRLYPTTNGFMYKISCQTNGFHSFDLEVEKPFMQVRANDKCFSLMSEHFRPFVTVSCIGTADKNGDIIAPAGISYQKINDRKYHLTVTPCSPQGKWVLFEANLHEAKLIQDTTVESANPKINNAFGSIAFVGNTARYGEQWLYSRIDFLKLSDLFDKEILKAVVHLPVYNHTDVDLSAFKVSARFCSFGSTWDSKVAASNVISDSVICNNYQNIDITALFADKFGRLVQSEGIVLKPRIKGGGFTAISTGDSCYAPQIFEIKYK